MSGGLAKAAGGERQRRTTLRTGQRGGESVNRARCLRQECDSGLVDLGLLSVTSEVQGAIT
jgi:hypothetical protein